MSDVPYTVYAKPVMHIFSTWPPCAKKIHRQGRPGKDPRKVVAVRVKACTKRSSQYTLAQ